MNEWQDANLGSAILHPFLSATAVGKIPFPSQRMLVTKGEAKAARFIVTDVQGKPRHFASTHYRMAGAAYSGSSRNKDNYSGYSFGLYRAAETGAEAMRVAADNANLLLGVHLGNRQHLFEKSVADPADGDHVRVVWADEHGQRQSRVWPVSETAPLALPFPMYGGRAQAGPVWLEIEIQEKQFRVTVTDASRATDTGHEKELPVVLFTSPWLPLAARPEGHAGVTLEAEAAETQTVTTAIGELEIIQSKGESSK